MITPTRAAAYMKLPTVDEPIETITKAVNELVNEWHGDDWPAGVELGALMLIARLHRRRNSPQGIESFSDMGAAYVSRYDADLDRQLRINNWLPPRVG